MTADPPRCALNWCASTDGVRHFLPGMRCRAHSPAAMAGRPEPDEIAARAREIHARHAAETAPANQASIGRAA